MIQFSVTDEPELTQRELQILRLVAMGMSAKQIAQQIQIAPRTVERHIENCRHKLRARNKTHLVAKAMASGDLRLALPAEDVEPAKVLQARVTG